MLRNEQRQHFRTVSQKLFCGYHNRRTEYIKSVFVCLCILSQFDLMDKTSYINHEPSDNMSIFVNVFSAYSLCCRYSPTSNKIRISIEVFMTMFYFRSNSRAVSIVYHWEICFAFDKNVPLSFRSQPAFVFVQCIHRSYFYLAVLLFIAIFR